MRKGPLPRGVARLVRVAAIVGLLAVLAPQGLRALEYLLSDTPERAGMDTERVLRTLERTGDPAPVRVWLLQPTGDGRGEGNEYNVWGEVRRWSLMHPMRFTLLVDSLTPSEYVELKDYYLFEPGDGFQRVFLTTYRGSTSPRIRELVGAMAGEVSPTATPGGRGGETVPAGRWRPPARRG